MKPKKDNSAEISRQQEAERQARIRQGQSAIDEQFKQFDDNFFTGRQQAYLDYANPQLNDQYADTRKQLMFALDRSGVTDSSIRAQREGELQKLYETNRRSVADKAMSYGSGARNSVEDARADLIRTLNSTADATAASNQAIARAQALSQPDAFSPLGQLFSSFTSGLSKQAGLERAEALSGNDYARYNTGLFGASKDAVKYS